MTENVAGLKGRWRSGGGQAAVEFILVLPVLLIVAAAVFQVALSLNCYLVITGASREGARRGAETNDPEAARKAALSACGGLPGVRPQVKVSFPEGREKGDVIKVSVEHTMPLLIPSLGHLVPRPTFKRTTCMALEKGR